MAKATFKESTSLAAKIINDIKNGTTAPIYTLMGEEPYFIDRVENAALQHLLSPSEKDFNLTVLYGKDSNARDIALACRRYPMMAARQVIIVREAQMLAKIEELEPYAKNPTPTTVLVLCHKGKNIDKRSTLFKALDKNGVLLESVPPRDYELEAFIKTYLSGKKLSADAKAVAMLCEFIGPNLSKLDNEISKLITLIPENQTKITPELIEQNIGVSKDYNIFELTRALSTRNFGTALRIADHFASNPKNYPLVLTLSMLFTHFQRIVMVGIMQWEAKRRGTVAPNDMVIAKQLGLTPYFVGEYISAARNYPTKRAFEILALLREYDMRSKGVGGQSADDGELLRELLLRISIA